MYEKLVERLWTRPEQEIMHCRNCGETEHIRGRLGPVRIAAHAGLALLTKGAWLLVWAADWMREKARWACPECGKERGPLARYKTDAEFELPHKDIWHRAMAGLALVLVLVVQWPSAAPATESASKVASASPQQRVAPAPSASKQPTPSEIAKAREIKANEARVERCTTGAASLRESAEAAMKSNDPQKAFEILNPCGNLPIDVETQALLTKALNAAKANDEKAEKARLAVEKTRLAGEKARRKKEGVGLGMTQQEVIESSWGKPQKINRSTYTFGVKEQWVYGGGNYLYFNDGILNSIQN